MSFKPGPKTNCLEDLFLCVSIQRLITYMMFWKKDFVSEHTLAYTRMRVQAGTHARTHARTQTHSILYSPHSALLNSYKTEQEQRKSNESVKISDVISETREVMAVCYREESQVFFLFTPFVWAIAKVNEITLMWNRPETVCLFACYFFLFQADVL